MTMHARRVEVLATMNCGRVHSLWRALVAQEG
jgi:hypothetical protein